MNTPIEPYLPDRAKAMVRAWESGDNGPVIVLAFTKAESDFDACRNCAGVRGVYLYFMEKGWHESPNPDSKVISKHFDGDARFHRGWYNTSRREAFPCPHCEKHPKPDKPYVLPPQGAIQNLAKKMSANNG